MWLALILTVAVVVCAAQEQTKPAEPGKSGEQKQPPVRMQMINPCTPSEAEQKELASALRSIPANPKFSGDFEIARGRTTPPQGPVSQWVRIRKDFPDGAAFLNAQYSISRDEHGVEETLVMRPRDVKEILQLRIEDAVTTGAPAEVVAADTPASRIRVERMGKSSLTLGRCVDADQFAYEPLFKSASEVMSRYRVLLGVKRIVPPEMARLGGGTAKK